MAFGKKKDEQAQNPAEAAGEAESGDGSLESAFASGAEAPAGADAADAAAEVAAPDAPPAPEPVAEAVAEAPAAGADDLLSAFQTTDSESADRSMIIELAGEHDIDDLLEELHTVATALGIVFDEDDVAA